NASEVISSRPLRVRSCASSDAAPALKWLRRWIGLSSKRTWSGSRRVIEDQGCRIAMHQTTIVPHGDLAAVVIPTAVLESLGLRIGDAVDLNLGDGQLILRPVEDAARRERVEAIRREVFEHRRDAYERLA